MMLDLYLVNGKKKTQHLLLLVKLNLMNYDKNLHQDTTDLFSFENVRAQKCYNSGRIYDYASAAGHRIGVNT